jgi:hypothetical protein
VVRHPDGGGSARGPDVLSRQGVGVILNARINDKGSLVAEAWFNVDDAERVDSRVLSYLRARKPMEASTGLGLDEEDVGPNVHNGKSYERIARNYQPDHVAVLLDGALGACSVNDGCGVLMNEDGTPCKSFENYQKAIANALTHLEKRNSNRRSPTMDDETRKNIVDALITNAECCWEEGDREFLSGLDDAQLKRVKATKDKETQFVANARNENKELTAKVKTLEDAQKTAQNQAPEGEGGKGKTAEPPTEEQWMAQAPETVRNRLAFADKLETQAKQDIVDRLVDNLEGDEKTKTAEGLAKLTLEALEGLRPLAPKPPAQVVANYGGAMAGEQQPTEDAQKHFGDFGCPSDSDYAKALEPKKS